MLRQRPVGITIALLFVLALGAAAPPSAARAGEARKQGPKKENSKKEDAAKEQKKPEGEPGPVQKISDSGYAQKLLELDAKQGTFNGLSVKASAIPDAYRYLMAVGLEEIEKQGLGGSLYLSKLKELNTRNRMHKGKILILVSLETADDRTYCILTQEQTKKCFKIRQKIDVPFTIEGAEPRLQYEQYKVFEYPPGEVRGFSRPKLCVLKKAVFRLVADRLKTGNQEPIRLGLPGIAVQTRSSDPNSSINAAERQLSIRKWGDILLKDAELTFTPATWDVPKPPDWFEELLTRLEKV